LLVCLLRQGGLLPLILLNLLDYPPVLFFLFTLGLRRVGRLDCGLIELRSLLVLIAASSASRCCR